MTCFNLAYVHKQIRSAIESNGGLKVLWPEAPKNTSVCERLAKSGGNAHLAYAHASGFGWNESTLYAALKSKSLACFSFAHEHGCKLEAIDCSIVADVTLMRDYRFLGYLLDNDFPIDDTALNQIARSGNATCLKKALMLDLEPDSSTMMNAVDSKNVECVKLLRKHGCKWNKVYTENAAAANDITMLTYLRENGCKWDKCACVAAVSTNALDCLKYLHEQGCPWDESICFTAVLCGHLDCLIYAHENHCSWDYTITRLAAKHNRLECLKYAIENGCDFYARHISHSVRLEYKQIAEAPGNADGAACLAYLHKRGYPLDDKVIPVAVEAQNYDALEYALANNCPIGKPNIALLITAKTTNNSINDDYDFNADNTDINTNIHLSFTTDSTNDVLIKRLVD